MAFFDGFAQGLASAVDDIRHQVVEVPMYGQQTTGNIELPQVEAPTIEAPSSGVIDLASPNSDPSWGVSASAIEPPVEAVSWQQAAQGIESPQIEAPQPQQDMER